MNNDIIESIKKINILKLEIEENIYILKKNKNNKNRLEILKNKLNCYNNLIENNLKLIKINNEIYKVSNINDKEIEILIKEEINLLNSEKNNILFNIESIKKSLKKINYNNKGCLIEIKLGTGGNESSLFIENLYKMYIKYFYKKNWNFFLINKILNNKGGYKEIVIKVLNEISYEKLKFESGGHRVQRIPETESKNRIHTSTCIVAVTPIIEENYLKKDINLSDLKIDTFKSSGSGGQHVNTTDSAIRVTHIPTGIVVECQDERSQHRNKSKAISILKSKINFIEEKKIKEKNNIIKKKLLGTGHRIDRIRTYNFVKNRITDHRFNITIYNKLFYILNGELDILLNILEKK
ncbi:peptide chain release factor 1 [endosymbiont of Euscepes postfasciatus]|uniref:PCRF domain-containing protein n=1 Tax=endosymbiont of Euscepes postfasciatus TaxID=650377 RepID=UPI000DC72FB9|nr:PCRF domain-containing protein [endosymbiont of Euscepes postfasciatus]BBA84656.1 peptide chain release factor 1 [endosymbiont of Euscepes postfasciatus]